MPVGRDDSEESALAPGPHDPSRAAAPPPRRAGGLRADRLLLWVVVLAAVAGLAFYAVLAIR